MANVNLKLSYKKLSHLLQEESNKQDIEIRGHKVAVDQLVMTSDGKRLRVTGKLNSTWDAYFDFSATPSFNTEENKLVLNDIKLDLDSKNLIFKGILKLAKGNIKSRLEKTLENPLSEQLTLVEQKLDEELANAPLPFDLALESKTSNFEILDIQAMEDFLLISAKMDQEINISFRNE